VIKFASLINKTIFTSFCTLFELQVWQNTTTGIHIFCYNFEFIAIQMMKIGMVQFLEFFWFVWYLYCLKITKNYFSTNFVFRIV
jgi:hypothetical protein